MSRRCQRRGHDVRAVVEYRRGARWALIVGRRCTRCPWQEWYVDNGVG